MIPIIFGARTKRHAILLFRAVCHRCAAITDHLRVLDKTVAHAYYLPLFPLRSKRLVICGGCGLEKPDLPELDNLPLGGMFGAPNLSLGGLAMPNAPGSQHGPSEPLAPP